MSSPEVAVFGGGCFWCIEAVFEQLRGVTSVVSGYAGGTVASPSYDAVCGGRTGHAEVVQVTFDPEQITYRDLLDVFFAFHDPTTLNRQGPDVGTQYRSAIYTTTAEQATIARAAVAEFERSELYADRIVTELAPLDRFWPAEDYHQGYYRRNPERGYCSVMITPKLEKLRAKWGRMVRRET